MPADDAAADEAGQAAAADTTIGGGTIDDATRLAGRTEGAEGSASAAEEAQQVNVASLDDLVEFFITAGKKGIAVNRYKGLGEMNPDTLWRPRWIRRSGRCCRSRPRITRPPT
jgi:DNA gyrase subunit B